MPQLGESVTEGTITRWLKAEGDEVELDEPLAEVDTDKVNTELPSPLAGTDREAPRLRRHDGRRWDRDRARRHRAEATAEPTPARTSPPMRRPRSSPPPGRRPSRRQRRPDGTAARSSARSPGRRPRGCARQRPRRGETPRRCGCGGPRLSYAGSPPSTGSRSRPISGHRHGRPGHEEGHRGLISRSGETVAEPGRGARARADPSAWPSTTATRCRGPTGIRRAIANRMALSKSGDTARLDPRRGGRDGPRGAARAGEGGLRASARA